MSKIPVSAFEARHDVHCLSLSKLSLQTPKEGESRGSESGPGADSTNLNEVSDKLASLKLPLTEEPRTAQIDANPFDDDESDEEQDLTDYTEEEIG